MVHIRAKNSQVEKEIKSLIDLVEEGGGGFHSKMLIESGEDGGLSIKTTEPLGSGKELIRISKKVVLPTDQCDIGAKGDELIYSFKEGNTLSDLQKKLFDSMFNLYNLSGKIAFQKNVSFLLGLKDHPDVVDQIMAARTVPKNFQDHIDKIKQDLKGRAFDDFIAGMFLKTRQLGYSDRVRSANVSILMPVIDFMNHHWYGSAFGSGHAQRATDLVVNVRQPEDSLECYAYYGPMDALDTLVRYDFMDVNAPVVRSAPIELDVMGRGTIQINGNFGGHYTGKLSKKMQRLQLYVPSVRLLEGDCKMAANYLFIPYKKSPLALRHVLRFLLTSFMKYFDTPEALTDKEIADWVSQSEEKIIQHNKKYYEGMLSTAEKLQHKELKALCDLQLMKLNEYGAMEKAA